jgi:hypothetical protein
MMRLLGTILAVLIWASSFAQNEKVKVIGKEENLSDPFLRLSFDKVIAYNMFYDTVRNEKLYSTGQFANGLENFKYATTFFPTRSKASSRRNVDKALTKEFIAIVSDPSTYGEGYADCFTPRLGLTFFKDEKEVFSVLICFECGFLESTSTLPAARHYYREIPSIEQDNEGNDRKITVIRYKKGFSKKGKDRLLKLCGKLNMNYCDSEN